VSINSFTHSSLVADIILLKNFQQLISPLLISKLINRMLQAVVLPLDQLEQLLEKVFRIVLQHY